jgi:phosphatidylethanolamine-binding protein (PEBP) family uncharacterized protein
VSLLLLALAAVALVVGCGTSGRDLRAPVEGAVSPSRSTSTTVPVTTFDPTSIPGGAPGFALLSSSFANAGSIPAENTCTGPSPALSWSGIPSGAKELVLFVTDSTDGYVHWLVSGIDPKAGALAPGEVPAGATQHPNSDGNVGWLAPCPAPGAEHVYTFTLVALNKPSAIAAGTAPKDAIAALQAQVDQGTAYQAVLQGSFSAGGTASSGGTQPATSGTAR